MAKTEKGVEKQCRDFRQMFESLRGEIGKVIVGHEDIIEDVLVAQAHPHVGGIDRARHRSYRCHQPALTKRPSSRVLARIATSKMAPCMIGTQ